MIALVGFVLLLMHLAAPVLVPALFAFFLAALAYPPFRLLQRRGARQGPALFLLVGLLLVLGVALVLLSLYAIGRLQSGLEVYSDEIAVRVAGLEAALAQAGFDRGVIGGQMAAITTSLLTRLLSGIAATASNGLVSLVIVAFFLLESDRVLSIIRSDVVRGQPFLGQAPEVARTAVRYFGIRTRLNLITGAGVILICWLIGIDYPWLWGLVAFVLSYIPYIGLLTAMLPPALLALAEFGWPQAAVVVVGITAMNLAIENIVEPGYTGKRLQLSPTIVFVSFFFWAWLLGPVGALLSMPITVMLLLVFQSNDSTRWLARIIGANET